jgi:hypothetical protein
MDRDSFNSGDWFNAVDWSLATTNWGNGLPVAEKNQDKWPIMQPLLADPALSPQSADVFHSAEQFVELLKIRKSSKLFRLQSADDIIASVAFHNTGPAQIPGLIVMSIADDEGNVDLTKELAVSLFNASDEAVTFGLPAAGREFDLHPVQAASVDPVVQGAYYDAGAEAFHVPARTTAVFFVERPIDEQIDVLIGEVNALVAAGALQPWRAYVLLTKLKIAKFAVLKDRPKLAQLALGSFAFHVKILVQTGRLPAEDGAVLLSMTEEILGSIG